MDRAKIKRMVAMIKRLTVEELTELNKKLQDEGIPPLEYTGAPAKPKPNPPTLTDAIGTDLEGEPLIKRNGRRLGNASS